MKILALNSGGFDSVVMIHHLVNEYEDVIIDTLFFNWSQPNYRQEKRCAKNVAKKLELGFKEIKIDAKNIWKDTTMQGEGYIPMRNMVFISSAVAYAQKNGYDKIAVAVIDNEGETDFYDCSEEFYEGLNNLLACQNIEVITPFMYHTKEEVGYHARLYNITKDEFFSCNTPVKGKPCNTCGDCVAINDIYEYIIEDITLMSPCNKAFNEKYWNYPIVEARLLINNECQFRCKHCFYGFDKEIGTRLTDEEFKKVIDQCKDLNINHIHISGKEPLINAKIFELTKYMDEKDMTYDIVTNGVNVIKYMNYLRGCQNLNSVFVSVDSLSKDELMTLRDTSKHIINTIKALLENHIDIEVSIDLCKDNIGTLKDTLQVLHDIGVESAYVRDVDNIGNGKDIKILDAEDWYNVIYNSEEGQYAIPIEVSMNKKYYETEHEGLREYIDALERANDPYFGDCTFCLEKNCLSYLDQITITSDGYVLGCGGQVAYANYPAISPGNVKDKPLLDLIYEGKKQHLEKYIKFPRKGCYFTQL